MENKYITVAYKLYSIEDGERDFVEEAPAEHPFQFISGLGMTLDAFESQLTGLNVGDKFDFTIGAADAYGEYDEEHVIDLPKNIFLIDGKFDSERVIEGAVIPLMTAEGQRINGSVVEVKDDVVTIEMGADRVRLNIKKWAIQTKLSGTMDPVEEPDEEEDDNEVEENKE